MRLFFFPLSIFALSFRMHLFLVYIDSRLEMQQIKTLSNSFLFFSFHFYSRSLTGSSFVFFFTIQINDQRVQRAALRFGGVLYLRLPCVINLSLFSLSRKEDKLFCFFFFLLFRLTSFWRCSVIIILSSFFIIRHFQV